VTQEDLVKKLIADFCLMERQMGLLKQKCDEVDRR